MDVYDFDRTVYQGDASVDFWWHCFRRGRISVFRLFPLVRDFLLCLVGRKGRKEWKESFFSFLADLDDVEAEVGAFWAAHLKKTAPWFPLRRGVDLLVVSASPRFLLDGFCRPAGISLIATEMDERTGRIAGENCRGAEKLRRFRSEYPGQGIDRFYSDSLSDAPLALVADESFLVDGSRIEPHDFGKRGVRP